MRFIQTHKQEAMVIGGVLTAAGLIFSQAWLLVLASLVAGLPIAVNAWEALRYKQISIELLVTIALVGAVMIGEPIESAVVSFLFLFGDWLEQRSLAKTRSAIQGLAAAAPKTARLLDGTTIPVGKLAVGDQVRVLAGETVPADGQVISGQANIVEAAITGEPDAKRKQVGATVYSGTQVSDGTVDIEVEKTGTLTQGNMRVGTAKYWTADQQRVAATVTAVEKATAHPLGQALVADLQAKTMQKPTDVKVTRGVGVNARIAGHAISVGNQKVLHQPLTADQQAAVQQIVASGATLVLVTIDDKLVAAYGLRDQLRTETPNMLSNLKASGKKTMVLSGDSQAAVEHMMSALPVSQTRGGLLPADKVKAIKAAQARGEKVMFVGDGINDGPALAQADVGVAMGSGMDVAIDTADVILTNSRLKNLVVLFDLAKRMNRNIKQNLVIAIGTVALLLSGLLIGLVDMASGMLFHEISILLVIANALRLRHTPRKWQNLTAIKVHHPQTVNNENK